MKKRFVKAVLILFVIIGALGSMPGAGNAQVGGGGTVNGTVLDPNGAAVPGATVVARNIATGVETTKQTTDAGLYVITPLPPGEYTITVSANGFQTLIQEKVIVDALATVGVNITMKVGEVSEKVTV